jgi:predicted dehydrogenase
MRVHAGARHSGDYAKVPFLSSIVRRSRSGELFSGIEIGNARRVRAMTTARSLAKSDSARCREGAKRVLGVGLIGGGFIGRCHALAFHAAPMIFDLPLLPRLEMLAEIDDATAERTAGTLGFLRSTADWRSVIDDPTVDLVSICTPTPLHQEMVLAAVEAGKHVWCEKPLAPTPADAKVMFEAAEKAGVNTIVGFNYLRSPLIALAHEIVTSGEIGELIGFRGVHLEDYLADPLAPFQFRLDPASGHGVIADVGSHILSLARYLAGEIEEVSGQLVTVIGRRPVLRGSAETRIVEVDDMARAMLRFESGATGSIEASWLSVGRKLTLAFEVTCARGTILLDFERMNELQLCTTGQPHARSGFKTILAGPEHPNYGAFTQAVGHHIGFNDLKTIEAKVLIDAISGGPPAWPNFRDGWRVQQAVEAIARSSRERRWIKIAEM